MSELTYKPLGDPVYFQVIMGQSPPSSAYNDEGQGMPFYQGKADFGLIYPTPRKYCTEPTRIAEKDDILISVRAPVGPTNMANEKCSIGRGLAAIRCKKGVVPKFLLYALRAIEGKIADSVRDQGGGFTSIKRDQLKAFKIPTPYIDEQRRIVARIEELTRRAEEARKLRQEAVALSSQVLLAVVRREFDLLAEHYSGLLGELATIIGGNSIPEDAPPPEGNSDRLGLMKVADMNSSGNEKIIEGCKLETTFEEAKRRKLRILPAGSIVFPKRGGAIATNKKRILGLPAALDPNLMGVFPIYPETLKPAYLRWWFESIDLASIQEDGGIPQVNKKHLVPLAVPLPSPTEQEEIVSRLRAMQEKAEEITKLQNDVDEELAKFQSALLAKAFRGEL